MCPASACGPRITEIVSVRSKGMYFPTVQNPVQSYLQVQGSCPCCTRMAFWRRRGRPGLNCSTVFAKDNSPWGVFVSRTKLSLHSGMRYSPRSLYSSTGLVAPLAHICTRASRETHCRAESTGSRPTWRAMAGNAPRHGWHTRYLRHISFCNLQILKELRGFESNSLVSLIWQITGLTNPNSCHRSV